ncbi:MAG: hypothetical protein ACFCUJ_06075 [Thiotrichales bacterium]
MTDTNINPATTLIGTWEKATQADCAQTYPHTLHFHPNGLLFGHTDPPGTFTQWDTGTYEIQSPTAIRISTANDEIVTYLYKLHASELIFADPEGCEFSYRRTD